VIGNTAFRTRKIAEVTTPFKNRILITEDLERLRLALTLLYVNKGYLTSGAIIPDQDVASGVITVQIIEGKAHADRHRGQPLVPLVLPGRPPLARHPHAGDARSLAGTAANLAAGSPDRASHANCGQAINEATAC